MVPVQYLGLTLGISQCGKRVKTKSEGLYPTFVKVRRERLVGGRGWLFAPHPKKH